MQYTTISTKNMPRSEWLELRKNSIGGSDVSAIMGLNKYKSSLEVFGLKTETLERPYIMNRFMFTGIAFEPVLRDIFRYYDNTTEAHIQQSFMNYIEQMENVRLGKPIDKSLFANEVDEPDDILYSKEYPFLSANLDGIIRKDFERGEENGVLEIKTMNGWVFDKWEGGLPPDYYIQVQHYLLVTGFKYGRVFVQYDTNNYAMYLFEKDKTIQGSIIKATKQFWDVVVEARELIKNNQPYQHLEDVLIDGSEATEEFMKEQYTDPINETTIEGTERMYKLAKKLNTVVDMKKDIEEQERLLKNKIRYAMQEIGTMDFGDNGKITYKSNVKGVRVFRNAVK